MTATGKNPNAAVLPARPSAALQAESESVLVVPSEVLRGLCPQTFSRDAQSIRPGIVANARFMDRGLAEHDFGYKQVIPYVVIRHQDQYLLIRRTKKQTESRLHDLFSLGIGGHVNQDDAAQEIGETIALGMRRELTEEIGLEQEDSCELAGIINDDSTEVARVHTGLVYLLKTSSPQFEIMEPDKYTASWKSVEEIAAYYDRMESWAQIVFDYLLAGSPGRTKRWEASSRG